MGCKEHDLAPMMYCQKCDVFVCDSCHMRSHPAHYHYLFISKPERLYKQQEVEKATEVAEVAVASSEKLRSIEEESKKRVEEAIAIAKRNEKLKNWEKT